MKTNADDSLFSPSLCTLFSPYFIFYSCTSVQSFETHALFFFSILFPPLLPISLAHFSLFVSFSHLKKKEKKWIATVLNNMRVHRFTHWHSFVPLVLLICILAASAHTHSKPVQSFNTQHSSSSSEHVPIPNAINRMLYQNARTHTVRENDANTTYSNEHHI